MLGQAEKDWTSVPMGEDRAPVPTGARRAAPPRARRQPLYDQLVDVLRDKIANELEPGDLLPSERELTERYGLSRTTVRQALRELENLGLVYRRHGRGTFVASTETQAANLSQAYSFTEQMREMGRVPATEILEFSRIEADKYLASHMGLRIADPVFVLRRLRSADGVPMMLERTYLPVRTFMGLTRDQLEGVSLYEVMEGTYHERIRLAEEEFSAGIARPEEAAALSVREGSPVLDLVRTTTNEAGEVIEFTLSVARADQFRYKVSHWRG